MINKDLLEKFIGTAARLADAVEKHLADIPQETEMTIALHELRLAQASFDEDLFTVLAELEKQSLTYDVKDDKIKTRH